MELVEIGYIAKAHGIKGELFFKPFDEDKEAWFLNVKELYINSKKYSLKKARAHQVGYILILEEVNNRNEAEILKGKRVSLEKSFFESFNDKDEYFLNQIEGFRVFLKEKEMGVISGFLSTQAHEIIAVKTQEGVFEIPWVEAFIKEIVFESSLVVLDCPEDLFKKDFGSETSGKTLKKEKKESEKT